jgi:hypothetical protein
LKKWPGGRRGDDVLLLTKSRNEVNLKRNLARSFKMSKYIFSSILALLLAYNIGLGQASCDEKIFVADEDDLPYWGSSYTPCASSFSYIFEFDILRSSNPTNNVIVYPKVINSVLNISVNSLYYSSGTDYVKDGDSFTGTGIDSLRIGILPQGSSDAFANMDWSVHYYNDEPD